MEWAISDLVQDLDGDPLACFFRLARKATELTALGEV